MKTFRIIFRHRLLFGLILLVIALAVAVGFFYRKYDRLAADSGQASQAEVQALVKEVGKLIVLPQDEVPTIATVSDPAALADQAFFVEAKIGDKVLIYTNAKKAILYDPKAKKIVNVAPISIGS